MAWPVVSMLWTRALQIEVSLGQTCKTDAEQRFMLATYSKEPFATTQPIRVFDCHSEASSEAVTKPQPKPVYLIMGLSDPAMQRDAC